MKKAVYVPWTFSETPVTAEEFVSGGLDDEIRKRIRAVIAKEAPVSERLLIKRVINSFSLRKAGVNVRAKMDGIISSMNLKSTADRDIRTFWKDSQDPGTYDVCRLPADEETKRDVLDVAPEEICNGVCSLMKGKKDVIYGDLARAAAELFGYTRMGNNVTDMTAKGIALAVRKGLLKKKGTLYSAGKGL